MTGENVHVEVGGNTHIKGALLAAGQMDGKGAFIDNEQLTLETGTLTFANSTDSTYSSNTHFNIGTNIGFGTAKDPRPIVTDSIPKVNSSSLSLGNAMGYSSSKVLATLGKGDVQIGDLEHSDDLDRLNRDTEALNKTLYSGSVSTSVDATLDHRFFSEEGREEVEAKARACGLRCRTASRGNRKNKFATYLTLMITKKNTWQRSSIKQVCMELTGFLHRSETASPCWPERPAHPAIQAENGIRKILTNPRLLPCFSISIVSTTIT
ncbi:MAG: hypothetical protein AB7D06_02470 [Pedobacter sp.]